MLSLFVSRGSRLTCSHEEGLFLLKLVFALSGGAPVSAVCPSVGPRGPLVILVTSQGLWIGVGSQVLLLRVERGTVQ